MKGATAPRAVEPGIRQLLAGMRLATVAALVLLSAAVGWTSARLSALAPAFVSCSPLQPAPAAVPAPPRVGPHAGEEGGGSDGERIIVVTPTYDRWSQARRRRPRACRPWEGGC